MTAPPREPTPEMMRAGDKAWGDADHNDYVQMCGEIWLAMYDAAPSADRKQPGEAGKQQVPNETDHTVSEAAPIASPDPLPSAEPPAQAAPDADARLPDPAGPEAELANACCCNEIIYCLSCRARAYIAQQARELAAARADAERYRFWRKFYDCRFALKLGGISPTLQNEGYAKPVVALSFMPTRPAVEVADNYEALVDAAIDAAKGAK